MNRFIVLIALLCTSAGASAQPSDKFTGSLLWKISGNGLEQPSYILGTHHLYALEFFDEIPGAREALESSGQVVGELIMADQAALAARLQLAAMMPEDVTYELLLSPTDYKTLDEGFRELTGVGLSDQFKVFKPGMLSLMISQIIFAKANPGFDMLQHVPIDVYVQNHATDNGKPVIGLETVEDQVEALFESEPMKFQAEQLVCSIQHLDFGVESLIRLGEHYAEGNLSAMYTDGFRNPEDPCPSSEAAVYALLKGRNDRWLEKLPDIMAETPSFVAVGALHLAGEEGLLYQLDRLGYTVEPVN